jgi:hypothetical protein
MCHMYECCSNEIRSGIVLGGVEASKLVLTDAEAPADKFHPQQTPRAAAGSNASISLAMTSWTNLGPEYMTLPFLALYHICSTEDMMSALWVQQLTA